MAIVVAASVPRLPLFPQIWKKNQKSERPQLLHCSKNVGESTSLSRDPEPSELGILSDMEVHQRNLKSINNEKEEKPNDIWQLFKEAQQNILYLNKQRLLAMEELERLKIERNLLLDRVEQLEMKNQANVRRGSCTCICNFCGPLMNVWCYS